MYNQIVYGSLLNKDELKKQNINPERVELVKVSGFIRVFNQEPSWRIVKSIERAVMNIEENKSGWFNAIVIKNLDKEYIEDLDNRERGYDRINLKDNTVTLYNSKEILTNCIVYRGKSEKQNNKILPNREYFDICLKGAKSYSKAFYNDYLQTTYQNSLANKLELIKI